MQIVRTPRDMQRLVRDWRSAGNTVGFVPTMGAFHEGHLSLMRRARADNDVVVVSLFVNPTQFNDAADLAAYPRTEAADARLAADAGTDVMYAPDATVMYPPGFATTITVRGVSEVLEGAARGASHFQGVATVVAKLLNAVPCDRLYLGQKDAQQVAVLRRMIRDLDFDVEVVVCPTVREPDGLAMSSRNVRLRGDDRRRALALRHGLDAALDLVRGGERNASHVIAAATAAMRADGIDPEYFAAVDALSLQPMTMLAGNVLLAVAARVGPVRLIDNEPVHIA
ncbi:MAG TPA: pantoate--beta-alanine ligase [Gemmatimonadaceae bacterium]|nr:pantoate--beta-alanine ligase [Gemmatimonadaceae bacterium]